MTAGYERVGLLTGGGDKPYAHGLLDALVAQAVPLDFIGSDELNHKAVPESADVQFLNLRGSQRPDARTLQKVWRVLLYYVRLIGYAVTSRAKIFHVLWNNKIQWFDRTLLMLAYKLLGKKIVFTAHNVNAGERDGNDSALNRATLKVQYHLSDHIVVHTEKMKRELSEQFAVPAQKVSVVPFGINNTTPLSEIGSEQARNRLGLRPCDKVLLFFGNIAPYKGLQFLVEAMPEICKTFPECKLIVAGRVKDEEGYWAKIQEEVANRGIRNNVIERIEFVPDGDVEVYFKAADALVLPYTHVFQSGVLFLAYSFGLPVIASDVGSMKEDIVIGETGIICPPASSSGLVGAVREYFGSAMFKDLNTTKARIKQFANKRYSWDGVGDIIAGIYRTLAKETGNNKVVKRPA